MRQGVMFCNDYAFWQMRTRSHWYVVCHSCDTAALCEEEDHAKAWGATHDCGNIQHSLVRAR